MMKIEKYGIILNLLTEDKIELVRQWRNSPQVSEFMQFKGDISPLMQKQWFESVNNRANRYFIIEYQSYEIGVVNIKDINRETMTAEGGIFIADSNYIETDVPIRAVLAVLDFAFEQEHPVDIYITVRRDNHRAKRFNAAFGYKLLDGEDDKDFQRYILTKENYYKHRDKLINLLWN